MVHYRTFRNDDPPHLAEIWNAAFCTRGTVRLRHSSPLEMYVFAKPYFDPAGLVLAVDGNQPIGFAHAGFRANDTESALSYSAGVTCAIGVHPSHRHQGIGSELLRRCEAYLTGRGAQALYAGPMRPLNPFYFGLYGGSELPGFLDSDQDAQPFLLHQGYRIHDTCYVLQRSLQTSTNVVDGRFADLRRRYEISITSRSGAASWWQESVQGPIELVEFRMKEKGTGTVAAQLCVWDMEGFSWRWSQPAVGIVEFEVMENCRRKGLGKLLLAHLLRYLQDQYFSLVEVQTMESNAAAIGLYHSVGFEHVDTGHIYRK